MRITQGTFSFLPDFTDDEIKAQIQYCLDNDWPIAIEYTDDPHPRNTYWEMWGLPMFDIKDAAAIMQEVTACRKTFPTTTFASPAMTAAWGAPRPRSASSSIGRPKNPHLSSSGWNLPIDRSNTRSAHGAEGPVGVYL